MKNESISILEKKKPFVYNATKVIKNQNVVNLYDRFYINLNDLELAFLAECKSNNENKKECVKIEYCQNFLYQINEIDRFQEFANLAYSIDIDFDTKGFHTELFMNTEKGIEYNLYFTTQNHDDTFALANLLLTGVYVLDSAFTSTPFGFPY